MSAETPTTYADKNLTCVECKEPFIFSAGEQAFYAKHVDEKTGQAWAEPKRCKECRERRKAAREAGGR